MKIWYNCLSSRKSVLELIKFWIGCKKYSKDQNLLNNPFTMHLNSKAKQCQSIPVSYICPYTAEMCFIRFLKTAQLKTKEKISDNIKILSLDKLWMNSKIWKISTNSCKKIYYEPFYLLYVIFIVFYFTLIYKLSSVECQSSKPGIVREYLDPSTSAATAGT